MSHAVAEQAVAALQSVLGAQLRACTAAHGEVTIEVRVADWLAVAKTLHDHPDLQYQCFIDLSGVDYLEYGLSEWQTERATREGYDRAVDAQPIHRHVAWDQPRFAVVLHLLALGSRARLRVRTFLDDGGDLTLASVTSVWSGANWFEREAYDLFGITFDGHPDLRRILTDYDFQGHPFRKDFPLIGEVEMRYDAEQGRCVYEPVSIQPRVTVPKVFREDHRYLPDEEVVSRD